MRTQRIVARPQARLEQSDLELGNTKASLAQVRAEPDGYELRLWHWVRILTMLPGPQWWLQWPAPPAQRQAAPLPQPSAALTLHVPGCSSSATAALSVFFLGGGGGFRNLFLRSAKKLSQ